MATSFLVVVFLTGAFLATTKVVAACLAATFFTCGAFTDTTDAFFVAAFTVATTSIFSSESGSFTLDVVVGTIKEATAFVAPLVFNGFSAFAIFLSIEVSIAFCG